ncbi:flavin-dependent monooxygenase [Ravibacter arvi]|uniref:Flavin-dependent monooxygenase n=1 Tax=Ravibacter arvi TaxID=2051041 RepID=A0ABP8M2X3_9BACT
MNAGEIRQALKGASKIPDPVLQHIFQQRWLQIWVPEAYGGLGDRLAEGLARLYEWAKIDGSLGWMLTLCAGANYFSRNLAPAVAKELFSSPHTCFGGSGMIGGSAVLREDGGYLVTGNWRFATGAPHLSHFTLNARLIREDKPVIGENGMEMIRSFVVPKEQAEILPDWKSMGMRSTGTYSFHLRAVQVPEVFSFLYDSFFSDDVLDRVPFRVFADLTLLVNYLGMAFHFAEEAAEVRPSLRLDEFVSSIEKHMDHILRTAGEIEQTLAGAGSVPAGIQAGIHAYGTELVGQLSHRLIRIYTQLGIRASQVDAPVHQVLCDYFTATQHANFRPSPGEFSF